MIRRFIEDERGATAIEYGLIAMLLSIAIIVGVGSVSTAIKALFDGEHSQIAEALNNGNAEQ
jgi:pilus assembly protein Flp/PilA